MEFNQTVAVYFSFGRLWGTFLADVVIQMIGTDYARILRLIYAFAQVTCYMTSFHIHQFLNAHSSIKILFLQIRLTRTYGWVSNKNHLAKNL